MGKYDQFLAKSLETGNSKDLNALFYGEDMEKSHVKAHFRRDKNGKLQFIKDYDDARHKDEVHHTIEAGEKYEIDNPKSKHHGKVFTAKRYHENNEKTGKAHYVAGHVDGQRSDLKPHHLKPVKLSMDEIEAKLKEGIARVARMEPWNQPKNVTDRVTLAVKKAGLQGKITSDQLTALFKKWEGEGNKKSDEQSQAKLKEAAEAATKKDDPGKKDPTAGLTRSDGRKPDSSKRELEAKAKKADSTDKKQDVVAKTKAALDEGLKVWVKDYNSAKKAKNTRLANEIQAKIDKEIEKKGLDRDTVYSLGKTDQETDFDTALDKFLAGAKKKIVEHYNQHFPNLTPDQLKAVPGKKYVKIVQTGADGERGSAWAFIDKETGDIFKPAGWNKPAKHARGNILKDKNFALDKITAYGPQYLK